MKRFLKYRLFVSLCLAAPLTGYVWLNAEGGPEEHQKLETLGGGSGPDTSELSEEEIGYQGNWVKKKEWVREAEDVELQIQGLIAGITAQRSGFYDTKFAQAEKALDDFYMKNKVEKGCLDGLIEGAEKTITQRRAELIEALKTKNPQAALDDLAVFAINEQVAALKALLEQVKVDIESINEIDRAFEVRFKAIDDIIAKTMGSRLEAQRYLQQIYYILDDKKVRERVYKIKEILEQVKAVDAYLKNDLASDFEKLIATMNQQIEKTIASIKELEAKGVPLKQAVDKLVVTPEPKVSEHKKELKAEVTQDTQSAPPVVEKSKKIVKEESSFITVCYEKIITTVEWIVAQAQDAFDYLCGTKVKKLNVRKTRVTNEALVEKK